MTTHPIEWIVKSFFSMDIKDHKKSAALSENEKR